jgi:type IV fimbrial biogenesis protein FimT
LKQSTPHGFTLIELMVTITILAILVALGFPSYQQWMVNTRIRNATESIQNGLRLARSEASQRGTNVRFELTSATTADWTVCVLSSTATTTTTCSSAVSTIQSFVSAGGASNIRLGASTSSPITIGATPNSSVTANSGVTFNALGRPTDYGGTSVIRIDASSTQTGTRWLVTTLSAGGMVRMCDPQLPSTNPLSCS